METARPEPLLIAHWFNPPHVIPLVEVVPGPATSPEVCRRRDELFLRLLACLEDMGAFKPV